MSEHLEPPISVQADDERRRELQPYVGSKVIVTYEGGRSLAKRRIGHVLTLARLLSGTPDSTVLILRGPRHDDTTIDFAMPIAQISAIHLYDAPPSMLTSRIIKLPSSAAPPAAPEA